MITGAGKQLIQEMMGDNSKWTVITEIEQWWQEMNDDEMKWTEMRGNEY